MKTTVVFFVLGLVLATAVPTDPVNRKLDDGPRYQHVADGEGNLHLVDMWVKASDIAESARFNPDAQNVYHVFTRLNPTVSQPMLIGNTGLLDLINYSPHRRTIVLLYGWNSGTSSGVITVLVPAFLAAEDVNVIDGEQLAPNNKDVMTCYHYLDESLTRGGFNGRRCAIYIAAMAGGCLIPGNLSMGGLLPKTGSATEHFNKSLVKD